MLDALFRCRQLLVQAPSYCFYALFSWVFPTTILRDLAATTALPAVRHLLLRRSGIRLGPAVVVSFGVKIVGRSKQPPAVDIGARVAIAPGALLIASSYPEQSGLNQHPEVQPLIKRSAPIRVEHDAWVGAGAILLPGVTVGAGAIVGAGAVVTRDVAPYTVVAGVPARLVRRLTAPKEPPS